MSIRTPATYTALHAESLGWGVVFTRGKRAIDRDWQVKKPGRSEILYRMRNRESYGLLLKNVVVIDVDGSNDKTDAWIIRHGIDSPMKVRTSKGVHHFFALPDTVAEVRTRIRHVGMIDILMSSPTAGRYTIGPGSWIEDTETRYELRGKFLPPGELPPLPESVVTELNENRSRIAGLLTGSGGTDQHLTRFPGVVTELNETNKTITTVVNKNTENSTKITKNSNYITPIIRAIKNPFEYVLKIESIQGSGGSKGLVRAVCVLRDAGVPPAQALSFLVSTWNQQPTRVVPPWSEADILRAIKRHYEG